MMCQNLDPPFEMKGQYPSNSKIKVILVTPKEPNPHRGGKMSSLSVIGLVLIGWFFNGFNPIQPVNLIGLNGLSCKRSGL